MSEAQLTNHLVYNLQRGGLKKLMGLNPKKDIKMYREIGNSSFIADICVSISENYNDEQFDSVGTSFLAIEVKISDWQKGLYQAWRYGTFAEKSFLAVYKPYAANIRIEEFKKHNIGLIIFDETDIKVLHKPKGNRFQKNTYEADVRKEIWGELLSSQSVSPAC